jgi:hypothetical protein
LISEALLKHELHCHQNESHMMMPPSPATSLIFIEPTVLLGVLKRSFDPKPLSLLKRQPGQRGALRGIAKTVFGFTSIYLSANHEVPLMRAGLFSIPQPYPLMEHIHHEFTFGRIPYLDTPPCGRGLLVNPFVHPERLTPGLEFFRFSAPSRSTLRHLRPGVFKPDPLVTMHIGHEDFTILVQLAQKGGIFAIKTIETDPGKINPSLSGRTHHLQGQIMFSKEGHSMGRDSGKPAPFLIVNPNLRQIQPVINGSRMLATAQNSEYPHLAIVHLAEATAPLPGDPDRLFPFLRDAGLIDQQASVPFLQDVVCPLGHMANHAIRVPRGVGQEMVQRLFVGVRHRLGHSLHVFPFSLRQPFEVLERTVRAIASLCSKELAKVIEIFNKFIGSPPQGAVVMVDSSFNFVDARAGSCD